MNVEKNTMTVYQNNANKNNLSLEDFKVLVKEWIELDNSIKSLQNGIKEKRVKKNAISEIIVNFMCQYDIEDLNTKDGRIRCKQVVVEKPVSKKQIIERTDTIIDSKISGNTNKADIIKKLYETEKVQKVSLRRLKIT